MCVCAKRFWAFQSVVGDLRQGQNNLKGAWSTVTWEDGNQAEARQMTTGRRGLAGEECWSDSENRERQTSCYVALTGKITILTGNHTRLVGFA